MTTLSKSTTSESTTAHPLVTLGRTLKAQGYRFTTPTPETHRRVMARGGRARTQHDIFGWSKPFSTADFAEPWARLLAEAGALEQLEGGMLRSAVRYSSLHGLLLMHSRYPTEATDSVFFGPDTYRFARTIAALFERNPGFRPARIVDVGAGSGAGGLFCATVASPSELFLVDISDAAVRFAEVNAALNEIPATIRTSDILGEVQAVPDLILCNPPYLVDSRGRRYRHGGGSWGFDLSLRIVRESLQRLQAGGRLLLYTGTPVVEGVDLFFRSVEPLLRRVRSYSYEEIDPDVFGEELERAPYTAADRIAVVSLTIEAA
jgi:release factor glutamine methyltransferase